MVRPAERRPGPGGRRRREQLHRLGRARPARLEPRLRHPDRDPGLQTRARLRHRSGGGCLFQLGPGRQILQQRVAPHLQCVLAAEVGGGRLFLPRGRLFQLGLLLAFEVLQLRLDHPQPGHQGAVLGGVRTGDLFAVVPPAPDRGTALFDRFQGGHRPGQHLSVLRRAVIPLGRGAGQLSQDDLASPGLAGRGRLRPDPRVAGLRQRLHRVSGRRLQPGRPG